MSEFTAKMIKEARIKSGYTQDEAAEGEEQRLAAKYSYFFKLLEKLSDREVEDVRQWPILFLYKIS